MPGPGEVVIRPAFCGLCGTDVELRDGLVDPAFVALSAHARTRVVGGGRRGRRRTSSGIAPGERCVAECIVPCGHCASCRAGATNVCTTYAELGFTREGGASDQVVVPARLVHVLSPGRLAARRRARRADRRRHARAREGGARAGRARARDRRRHDRTARDAPRRALVAGGDRHARDGARSRRRSPSSMGATSFTTDDAVASGFDLVIEAAGVARDDGARRAGGAPRRPRAAARPAAGRTHASSCRPTCSSTTTSRSPRASATPRPPGPGSSSCSTPARSSPG